MVFVFRRQRGQLRTTLYPVLGDAYQQPEMEALRGKNDGLEHFFYSCLFLFLNEKQAVTFVVGKSWLMGQSLWCAGSFILSLHLFRIKGYIFVVPDRILLLVREG